MEQPHFEPDKEMDTEVQQMMAEMRLANADDLPFITEMSRYASTIDGRPLPDTDSDEVQGKLPGENDIAIVATSQNGEQLGAIWTYFHEPPLLRDDQVQPLPEII